MRFLTGLLVACCTAALAGCAVTYPLFGHQAAERHRVVENKAAVLDSGSPFVRLQIEAGRIDKGRLLAELPVGSRVTIRSYWRSRYWSLFGAREPLDFAVIRVHSRTGGHFTARLPVDEFDHVFDGSRYYPDPPAPPDVID